MKQNQVFPTFFNAPGWAFGKGLKPASTGNHLTWCEKLMLYERRS